MITAVLGSVAAFLAPVGKMFFGSMASAFISNIKDKKAAEEKAKKLLFNVYLEVTNNLDSCKGFSRADFNRWKINGKDCKIFAAQLQTKCMQALLLHITDIKKINESEVYNAMLRIIFTVREIKRLSKLTDSMLEEQPNFNLPRRFETIKKHNLFVYQQLFKKEIKGK